jgi:hypothetical protein
MQNSSLKIRKGQKTKKQIPTTWEPAKSLESMCGFEPQTPSLRMIGKGFLDVL